MDLFGVWINPAIDPWLRGWIPRLRLYLCDGRRSPTDPLARTRRRSRPQEWITVGDLFSDWADRARDGQHPHVDPWWRPGNPGLADLSRSNPPGHDVLV